MEAAIGIEPMNKGFADLCLTTWLRRPEESGKSKGEGRKFERGFLLSPFAFRLDIWSGRRDLNSRLRPWQGRTLPLSYSRLRKIDSTDSSFLVKRVSLVRPQRLFNNRPARSARAPLAKLLIHPKVSQNFDAWARGRFAWLIIRRQDDADHIITIGCARQIEQTAVDARGA